MNNLLIPQNIGTYYVLELNNNYNIKAIQNGVNNIFKNLRFKDAEFKRCVNFISNNTNIGTFIYKYLLNNIEKFSNKNLIRMKSDFIIECFNGYVELIHQLNNEAAIEWYVECKIKQQILKVKPLMENIENKIMELI